MRRHQETGAGRAEEIHRRQRATIAAEERFERSRQRAFAALWTLR